jgi:hypothetical protein
MRSYPLGGFATRQIKLFWTLWNWVNSSTDSAIDIDITCNWYELYRSFPAELHRDSIEEIKKWLEKGNVPERLAIVIAQSVPVEYLVLLEEGQRHPRISQMAAELERIQNASSDLKKALVTASEETLKAIASQKKLPWEELEESGMSEIDNEQMMQFITDGRILQEFHTVVNDQMIDALQNLYLATKQRLDRTPKDRGGSISGRHDREGSWAKELLALETRQALRSLGLPCGCHKNGPVSRFISLVHQAATGEYPNWGDRYAARVSALEKPHLPNTFDGGA